MKNHEFNTVKVSDDTEMEVYLAMPEGVDDCPAIIVLQEAFGVTHHIRSIADRLCKQGYAAVAPDLYHRTGKRLEFAYTDFPSAMPHYQGLTQMGETADLKACYDWLQQQTGIDKDKTGSVGFCLGGQISFLANATLPLSAAVSYYGGGLENLADKAPNLHADHLFYWGGKDTHITIEKVDTIINAVKATGKNYTTVTIADAEHGFNCDDRASYNPKAAKEAWALTLAFFDDRLK